MSKLSKNSIYAIKYLHNEGLSVSEIASETNLSLQNVQSVVEEIPKPKSPTSKDLMITKTAVKNNNTVAIMTKEASMMNDHNKSKLTSETPQKTDHIFKPIQK